MSAVQRDKLGWHIKTVFVNPFCLPPLTGAAHNNLSYIWKLCTAFKRNTELVFNLPSLYFFGCFFVKQRLIVFQAEFDMYWFEHALVNAHTPCIGSCPNPSLWGSSLCLAVIVYLFIFLVSHLTVWGWQVSERSENLSMLLKGYWGYSKVWALVTGSNAAFSVRRIK